MNRPTNSPTSSGGGNVAASPPPGVPSTDRREIERAAVACRDRGLTSTAAGRELARRFGDDEQVAEIAAAVYAYTIDDGTPQHDDRAARYLAPLLAPRHRFSVTPGNPEPRPMYFDGTRWRDDSARVELLRSIEHAARDAADVDGLPPDNDLDLFAPPSPRRERKAIAAQLSKSGGKAAAIRALVPLLKINADAFDSRPDLVALGNGTLYTRGRARGRMRPHRAEDYLTTGVDLDLVADGFTGAEPWFSFGLSILDPEVWRWLNLVLARWALHGSAPPFLVVLHGPTRTGKTTLVETVLALLGDLGSIGSLAAFTEQTQPGPNSARAAIHGPRFVSMSEAGTGDVLASQPLKTYTGGGTTAIEEKYQRQRNAKPSALIVLDSNYRPRVDGADDAVMRRLLLVPFGRRFYDMTTEAGRAEYDAAIARGESAGVVDPDLPAKLKTRESLEAVLSYWAALLRSTPDAEPTPPLVVQRATEAWRSDANPVAGFIESAYVLDPSGEVTLTAFADELRDWLAAYLPDRLASYRDNRQVAAALRELPPRTLRIEPRGRDKTRTVVGLRRVEGGEGRQIDEASS